MDNRGFQEPFRAASSWIKYESMQSDQQLIEKNRVI